MIFSCAYHGSLPVQKIYQNGRMIWCMGSRSFGAVQLHLLSHAAGHAARMWAVLMDQQCHVLAWAQPLCHALMPLLGTSGSQTDESAAGHPVPVISGGAGASPAVSAWGSGHTYGIVFTRGAAEAMSAEIASPHRVSCAYGSAKEGVKTNSALQPEQQSPLLYLAPAVFPPLSGSLCPQQRNLVAARALDACSGRLTGSGAPTTRLIVHCVASGTCGENATWTLTNAGVFTVSGTGAMTDYALPVDRPWVDYISQIKEVVIESGITTIGNRAFVLCENMTRVTIPDGITRIGIRAFIACYALEAAIIPDGVTYIGDYAFYECRSMTELVLPDSITEIGMQSFRLCTSLPSVTVPPKLTVLPRSSFYDCDSLTSFVVPDQVTTIGPYAIYNCDKLEELTFGKSVASIDYYAVYRSYSLKKITFTGNAPTISANDVFGEVTATVYYPANDATWTATKRQNYGGTLTWVAY